jgi:hypothetical protein
MLKAFSAIVVAALIAGAITILPGLSTDVEASAVIAIVKIDPPQASGSPCAQRGWPYAQCQSGPGRVRLIALDRLQ